MSANTHARHQWLQAICAEEPLTLIARGKCMAPLITDGARLQVSPAQRYYPGDVIVLRAANGTYLAHRLLGTARWRGEQRVVTRGDHSSRVDGRTRPKDVLGRVCGGECDVRAVRVSALQRIASGVAFTRFLMVRLVRGRRGES